MVVREKKASKFRVVVYLMDTIYTPIDLLENPTSIMTMTAQELENEFMKEVIPIVEKSLGKVERMNLVQKIEGAGWAMVGFQMDGKGFSVEPRIFVYDSKFSFEEVLGKSYGKEKMPL